MNNITVKNIRCFHGEHSARIAPITLLVGENSSGKSTFLALVRIAWDLCVGHREEIDFNEEPFILGSFDQIASYPGDKLGRSESFEITYQLTLRRILKKYAQRGAKKEIEIKGVFEKYRGEPKLSVWSLTSGSYSISINFDQGGNEILSISTPSGSVSLSGFPRMLRMVIRRSHGLRYFLGFLPHMSKKESRQIILGGSMPNGNDLNILDYVYREAILSIGTRPYPFAPIRTRPRRTYDPLREVAQPEGAHVPMFLAKTISANPEGWQRLKTSLSDFGKASGLFNNVQIRRLGKKEGGPFQLRVKITGPARNLVDVGYGVSQVLPILVDCLKDKEGGIFLLQQPEVHLHPSAQAELGTFLGYLAKEYNKQFIIETHSDYLIDRIKMDVRDKKHLRPNDISIAYFELEKGGAKIYNINIDEHGNLKKVPPGYRKFFLKEETRFFEG